MNVSWFLVVILLPFVGGALLPVLPLYTRGKKQVYIEGITIATSLVVLCLMIDSPTDRFRVLDLAGALEITFYMDGLSKVFAGILAGLWPFAMLYAFEYMKEEGSESRFFAFYLMTYGVANGIAFAENFMTLYMFYEMLTLVTLPLVMHAMDKASISAGRQYVFYSIGGASFAFIGFILILGYGQDISFVFGGVLSSEMTKSTLLLLQAGYVVSVVGFGVKAAMFPFHGWLPVASVAPTPVTALLHAVAVVNAGAFAVIRITYYSFGTDLVKGTWAQNVVLLLAIITILYGSIRAVKEQHLKRRLAYSTISNLSYILFGTLLMSPIGMVGALAHMVFHSLMKIVLFFCAGAILHETKREYIFELTGLARKMPKLMIYFVISAFALVGVPPLTGFISKWYLLEGTIQEGTAIGYVGLSVLMISAFLSAIYLFTIIARVYSPRKEFDYTSLHDVKDPNWYMLFPMGLFCAAIVTLSLYSLPMIHYFQSVATGLY